MTLFAMFMGVIVWLLTDFVLLRRYVSRAATQEAKFRKGFVLSLNIALAIIALLVAASVFDY